MQNKLSLRLRITLLTGAMVLLTSLVLTAVSMHNANGQLLMLRKAVEMVDIEPPIEQNIAAETYFFETSPLLPTQNSADGKIPMAAITLAAAKAKTRFDYWSVLALVLVAGVGMGLSYYVAGRALAPVRRLSCAASEISAHNLQTRLPSSGTRDEIGGLTDAFNAMLDRLQDAFESQKRFSSNVAHELKTPLATMKLCVQTARIEQEGDVEFLDVTERAIDRLTSVVGDLLLLTNKNMGDMDEEIELGALLRSVAQELASLYAQKQLRIIYAFPQDEIIVRGNAGLARHVFYNLLENGMKYNRAQGVLQLGVLQCEAGARVTVEDEGAGIPEDAVPHLFEPFYCVDASRSRRLGGAGLGLSIVRAIADKHGWTVTAQNVSDGGACFVVDMPLQAIVRSSLNECV